MSGFLFYCVNSFWKQLLFVFTMDRHVWQFSGQFKSSFNLAILLIVDRKDMELS